MRCDPASCDPIDCLLPLLTCILPDQASHPALPCPFLPRPALDDHKRHVSRCHDSHRRAHVMPSGFQQMGPPGARHAQLPEARGRSDVDRCHVIIMAANCYLPIRGIIPRSYSQSPATWTAESTRVRFGGISPFRLPLPHTEPRGVPHPPDGTLERRDTPCPTPVRALRQQHIQ